MATPRVFISSTCYDLSEVRDSLVSFIQTFGFEPVLSDRGDVFYHPDLHTHASCINEISNCQLFILIIGGRFGGTYVMDPKKSIVNAEYSAAKEVGTPVFSFIKRDVLDDHRLYQKNKNKKIVSEIDFPSIENQSYAEKIFMFIDDVRHAKVNNGFFPFEYSKEIQELLSKQWAGLFFDLLQQRKINEQYKDTNTLLSGLMSTSSKLEDLVKSLYRNLAETEADNVIGLVDKKSMATSFFVQLGQIFGFEYFGLLSDEKIYKLKVNMKWFRYLETTGDFEIAVDVTDTGGNAFDYIVFKEKNRAFMIRGKLSDNTKALISKLEESYSAFKSLDKIQREEILSPYVLPF